MLPPPRPKLTPEDVIKWNGVTGAVKKALRQGQVTLTTTKVHAIMIVEAIGLDLLKQRSGGLQALWSVGSWSEDVVDRRKSRRFASMSRARWRCDVDWHSSVAVL